MALNAHELSDAHRLAFESAPDAIVVIDGDDAVVFSNGAARDLESRGCAIDGLREQAGFRGFRDELRLRGRATLEARIGERIVLVSGRALGHRALLFMRDVTAEREAEEDVTRLWGLASIGALTASLVHDLGNLMTPLATLGDALAQDPSARIADAIVEELRRATNSASELVRDVRGFLRGRSQVPEPLAVNRVLTELRPLLERVVGRGVTLTIMLDAEEGSVVAERTRLERALLNLVANARDAMPEGGQLTIRMYSAWFDGEAHYALSVADRGVGMSPSERARAFEPLFTTKTESGGTGLGLWMVRRFVREARGRLSIQSEKGEGTEITLYLPRAGTPFS